LGGSATETTFFTSRWSSSGSLAGISWRPATLFARGSARQLFDDWARTTPPQKAARGGETVSRALFAQSHSEHVVGVLYVSLVLV